MMFSSQARKTKVLFAAADIPLTAIAFQSAYATRAAMHLRFEHEFDVPARSLVLVFCIFTWLASGWWLDVYSRLGSHTARTIMRDAFRQALLAALGLLVFEFLLRLNLSRFFIANFALYSFLLFGVFRVVGGRLTGLARRIGQRFVFVVGTGERAVRLAQNLERAAEDGVVLRGFLSHAHAPASIQLRNNYSVQPLSTLPELLKEHVIDEILFAVDSQDLVALEEVFLLCDEEGVRTRVAVDFFPHVNSEIRLENLGDTQLLTFSAAPDDDLRLIVKRAIDLTFALATLAVLWPVFLAVAVAVRLTSSGPALFRQERCGLNGRKFAFYKFRSMCVDAEQRIDEVKHLSSRKTALKVPNDPRLTPIGGFLRRFSLDELPQLFNVVRGEMSLVGPRPAIPSEVAQYQRWQRRRLRMRPGLTCLWVVNGRDRVDFDTWMKLDLEYIDNWSLELDLKILLKTIPQVVMGRGAS